MPYAYQVGNYAAGDNYGRTGHYPYAAGSIFGKIGSALLGGVKGLITGGPLGAVAGAATALAKPSVAKPMVIPPPVIQRTDISLLPPRYTSETFGPPMTPEAGTMRPGYGYQGRRRRMNPMNVKALRRASRRIDGFARTARKALKHTPFMLVSRAARGRRGSPGVITRSEASRALRK
jgi:hypothetical protein